MSGVGEGKMEDEEAAGVPAAGDLPISSFPKQAVVVIHGMGEQMPMDTIKGFARAVWETATDITANGLPNPTEAWSKPDVRTGSLELRRITTRQTVPTQTFEEGVRSDFFELYWSDLSGGSTWSQVKDWVSGLLLRDPFTRVPGDVLLAWIVLWIVTIGVLVLAVATALPKAASVGPYQLWVLPPLKWLSGFEAWQLACVAAALGAIAHRFVVPYFGRVVRYTRATPDNIAARKNIRERGLSLLSELHKGEYERIIMVGHSLGSILAYDLVSYFWATRLESHTVTEGTPEFDALRRLEKAIADLNAKMPPSVAAYSAAQTEFARLLRLRPKPKNNMADTRWLITDLITVGSPLSHAEFLLAKSDADLRNRQLDREFPTSPPVREELDPDAVQEAQRAGFQLDSSRPQLACFPFGTKRQWQLHHATPFAAVRWTNIFDPARLVIFGDVISGPMAPTFGEAIVDVNLRSLRGQSWRFTHTRYWTLPKKLKTCLPRHIIELREALDVSGQRRRL